MFLNKIGVKMDSKSIVTPQIKGLIFTISESESESISKEIKAEVVFCLPTLLETILQNWENVL